MTIPSYKLIASLGYLQYEVFNGLEVRKGKPMKKKLYRWLPVILWMMMIFIFSSQNGSESEHNNRFLVDLLNHLHIHLDQLLGSNTDFYVRKSAHMTEYFILFLLLYRAFGREQKPAARLLMSLAIVFLYACTDEYHQSFIPGRGPSFRDVMIDTSGGFLALIAALIVAPKKSPDRMKKIFKK